MLATIMLIIKMLATIMIIVFVLYDPALIALTNLLYRSIVRYTLEYRLQTPGGH